MRITRWARYIIPSILAFAWLIASESAGAQTGRTIRGQVVDRDSQTPLPGANVVLLETHPPVGTTTDAGGWFVLENVPLGRRGIRVSFLGYEPTVLTEILVTSGRDVVLHVTLVEQIFESDEIVILPEPRKDRPLNHFAAVSARGFSVEETRRYAGGLDDPARMASAFAGVTTGGSIQENAMIIRGNAPKGVQWRLEGVEIPNPSHFADLSVSGGGGLTLFSSRLLADGDFFTSAFPAEYGNALAGVFDMSFRAGNPARREHAVQIGLLGVEFASEGPFVRGKASTYLFNYRYSTLGLLLPILPTEDVATYQDLSFKLRFPMGARSRLDVWGIGGLDGQSMSASEDSTSWEYETWDLLDSDLRLAVGAAGLSHGLILGPRTYVGSTAAISANRTRLEQRRIGNDLLLHDQLSLRTTLGRLTIGSQVDHRFGARLGTRSGFSVHRLFFDVNVEAAPHRVLVPVARGDGAAALLQVYSQSTIAVSRPLSLQTGVHVQHFALTGQTSIEPRAGMRWQFRTRHTLSAGYGLHSRIEDLRIYFAGSPAEDTPANRSLAMTRAHHAVAGYERRLDRSSRLKVEAYYQYLFDVPVIPNSSFSMINFEQDFEFSDALANDGLGTNAGVDVTLERFLEDGYYYLVSGSVFRSRFRGGDGVWRRTRFDQGYAADVLFGKEITVGANNLLGVNGRGILLGGKRRSPVDLDRSRELERVVFDERRAFAERQRGLVVFDLTLTFRRNHRRLSELWGLQIKNLLGAKDVHLDYNFATRSVEEVREGFPIPVLSYKIEF